MIIVHPRQTAKHLYENMQGIHFNMMFLATRLHVKKSIAKLKIIVFINAFNSVYFKLNNLKYTFTYQI